MPEENSGKKGLLDDESTTQNDETEDVQNIECSMFQKMRNTVRSFFRRKSTKVHGKERKNRKSKCAEQAGMGTNSRNEPCKDSPKRKNDRNSPVTENGNNKPFDFKRFHENRMKSLGRNTRVFEKENFTDRSSAIRSEESENKGIHKKKCETEIKESEHRTLKKIGKRPEYAVERTEVENDKEKKIIKENDYKKSEIIVNGTSASESFRIKRYQDNVESPRRIDCSFKNQDFTGCVSDLRSEEVQSKDFNTEKNEIEKKEAELLKLYLSLKRIDKRSECSVERSVVKNYHQNCFLKEKDGRKPEIAANGNVVNGFFWDNRYQDNSLSVEMVNRILKNLEIINCASMKSEESQRKNNEKKNEIKVIEDDGDTTLRENRKRSECPVERTEIKNDQYKDFSKKNDNKNTEIIKNGSGEKKSLGINLHQNNAITLQMVNLAFKNLELINCAVANKSEDSQSEHKNERNAASKDDCKVIKEAKNGSEYSTESNKIDIIFKRPKATTSKSNCSEIEGSPEIASEEVQRRHSEPPSGAFSLQRVQHNDTKQRPQSTNIPVGSKKFTENNLKSLRLQHHQSGSVIVLSNDDMNIKFTQFESDVGKIVDETQTLMNVYNPNLMSGGIVILEALADAFKIPDYYRIRPLILYKTRRNIQTAELCPFKKPPSITLVFKKDFTGGIVTDCSSEGACLPELFPLKLRSLCGKSAKRQLFGGQLVTQFGSESEIRVDVLSNIITIQETNNSNSSLDDDLVNESSKDDVSEARWITIRKISDIGESGSDCSILLDENSEVNCIALRSTIEPAISRNSERSSESCEKNADDSTSYGL